jgi:hypothetical protein
MATKPTRPQESTVTRTFRAAVKIGEDYVTIEESIALPLDASDADIANAVALGWRIYAQQRDAGEAQILEARESYGADRERSALPSQLQRIDDLQKILGWDATQLATYLQERRLDVRQLTRRQASHLIDQLRRLLDEQQRDEGPITKGQHETLQRMATTYGLELDAAVGQYLGLDVPAEQLTFGEASKLTALLQPKRRRP